MFPKRDLDIYAVGHNLRFKRSLGLQSCGAALKIHLARLFSMESLWSYWTTPFIDRNISHSRHLESGGFAYCCAAGNSAERRATFFDGHGALIAGKATGVGID